MNRIGLNNTRRYSDMSDAEPMAAAVRTTPVVWVVQEGNNDYAPAEKHGEVRFITRADLRSIPESSVNEQAVSDVKAFVEEYQPEIDFIVPVGNPMMIIYVTMLVSKVADEHKYLKWDGRQADYVVFKISDEGVIR